MSRVLAQSWYITDRHLRNLLRQPWWIAISLVQPIIYILLFSELFKSVVEIPGFQGSSYITFLIPGIVMMSALFSAGWGGMGVVDDLDRGVMDRLLVTPVGHAPLIAGRQMQNAMVVVVQSLILVGIGWLRGATFEGGVVGIVLMLVAAVLLTWSIGALSYALGLLARREETMIAAINFIILPMTFLSSVFMQKRLIPNWMQHVSDFNPLNWAVIVSREALQAHPNWGTLGENVGYLVALGIVCSFLAGRAFRSYQRAA